MNATQRNTHLGLISFVVVFIALLAFLGGRLLRQSQPHELSNKPKIKTSDVVKAHAKLLSFSDNNDRHELVQSLRPAGEWQGMPVNQDSESAACHPEIGCGLGLACVDGRCVGCANSSDCLEGEACVLQHCLLEEFVSCTARTDCGLDELCILSGISGDARGNADMHSFCMSNRSGFEQIETAEIEEIQKNIQDEPQFRMSSRQVLTEMIQH